MYKRHGEHEPVTLRIYVRYSDDDTILPYDYAVECLAEDMPWVTLERDPMPADDGVKLKMCIIDMYRYLSPPSSARTSTEWSHHSHTNPPQKAG